MTAARPTRSRKPSVPVLLLALAGGVWTAVHFASSVRAQSAVTVVGVSAYHSSVKVYFRPVPGARDYRVYDVNNPSAVKYAGWARLTPSAGCPGSGCFHHFVTESDGVTPVYPYQVASGASGGPQVLDIPATQIEWNNVGDGQPHTLVVEAVDALGPAPHGSLYTGDNVPMFPEESHHNAMLGGNKGPTLDGRNSTNGQGPYTNNPQVIARSQPFVVQANRNYVPVPSKPTASQLFLDTFENAQNLTIRQVARDDNGTDAFGNRGWKKLTMNEGTPKAWDIAFSQTDNINSMAFVSADHFMDMVFDGATPNTSAPTHTLYGSMAMAPVQTFDMSGGNILHLTMEVDGHQSFRRWLDMQIFPAADPLQAWDPDNHRISNSNQAVFLVLKDGSCQLDVYTGPASGSLPTGTAGGSRGSRLWGHSGSHGGGAVVCGWDEMYIPKNFSKNGYGLDDKNRYDLFLSQTRVALFQDGKLILQSAIPAGSFPWANQPVRASFAHYLYHSINDVDELQHVNVNGQMMCYPLNSFWFNDPRNGTTAGQTVCNRAYPAGYGFPNSDERHWDNMGVEVLPASEAPGNDFSVFASLVQHPAMQPPQFGSGGSFPPGPPNNLRILP